GRRLVWAFTFAVSASALAAVLVYARYDIGSVGPIPDMYEPLWYPRKTLAAAFEAGAIVTSVAGWFTADVRSRRSRRGRLRPVRFPAAPASARQPDRSARRRHRVLVGRTASAFRGRNLGR